MKIKGEDRNRPKRRTLRTIGLLLWLAIIVGGLWAWNDKVHVLQDWKLLQENLASVIPLGLMAAYGFGRLAVIWWPKRRRAADLTADVVVFRRSRLAEIGALVLFLAVGTMAFNAALKPDAVWSDWIAPVLISVFWFAALYRTIRRGTPLVLAPEGIFGTGLHGVDPLAWAAIDEIKLDRARFNPSIELALKPEPEPARTSTVERSRNRKSRTRHAVIFPRSYGVEPETLLKTIDEFHRRKVVFR
jgi:hypothetical protein